MNRGELRDELLARGHDYLADEPLRPERMIDAAAKWVHEAENWPARRVEATLLDGGSIPLLGQIDEAWEAATNRPIYPRQLSVLRQSGVDLTQAGVPQSYYFKGTQIIAWPRGTIVVAHFTRAIWVLGGRYAQSSSDTMTLGDEFDDAVLARARGLALADTDEELLRGAVQAELDDQMQRLRDTFLNTNADEPDEVEGNWRLQA